MKVDQTTRIIPCWARRRMRGSGVTPWQWPRPHGPQRPVHGVSRFTCMRRHLIRGVQPPTDTESAMRRERFTALSFMAYFPLHGTWFTLFPRKSLARHADGAPLSGTSRRHAGHGITIIKTAPARCTADCPGCQGSMRPRCDVSGSSPVVPLACRSQSCSRDG